jgi:hypothetical protein
MMHFYNSSITLFVTRGGAPNVKTPNARCTHAGRGAAFAKELRPKLLMAIWFQIRGLTEFILVCAARHREKPA